MEGSVDDGAHRTSSVHEQHRRAMAVQVLHALLLAFGCIRASAFVGQPPLLVSRSSSNCALLSPRSQPVNLALVNLQALDLEALATFSTPYTHILLLSSALARPLHWRLSSTRRAASRLPVRPIRDKDDHAEPTKCPVKQITRQIHRLDEELSQVQEAEEFNRKHNPYLQRNFAPVSEETTPTSCVVVEGALPA
jgi:hypothetical protein